MFQYIQKNPVFGTFSAHFPNFGGKKIFSRQSSIMPKFKKKLMIQFQENNRTD